MTKKRESLLHEYAQWQQQQHTVARNSPATSHIFTTPHFIFIRAYMPRTTDQRTTTTHYGLSWFNMNHRIMGLFLTHLIALFLGWSKLEVFIKSILKANNFKFFSNILITQIFLISWLLFGLYENETKINKSLSELRSFRVPLHLHIVVKMGNSGIKFVKKGKIKKKNRKNGKFKENNEKNGKFRRKRKNEKSGMISMITQKRYFELFFSTEPKSEYLKIMLTQMFQVRAIQIG